MYQR
jgi:hypothetical protein